MAARGGYAGPSFTVEAFHLYRSHLGRSGAVYEELAAYRARLTPQRPPARRSRRADIGWKATATWVSQ